LSNSVSGFIYSATTLTVIEKQLSAWEQKGPTVMIVETYELLAIVILLTL
jgi:hypothetical protein